MTRGGNGNGRFPWENSPNMKAAQYTRDVEATRSSPYEEKFGGFIRLCEEATSGQFQVVIVAFPEVLGDNYEELVRNLGYAAQAGLLMAVAGTEG